MKDPHALVVALKSCSDLQWGRRIHAKAKESQNDSHIYVVTALIKMYTKCSTMVDARRLFDSIQNPDAVSWTALLLGHAEHGEGLVSLNLFSRMNSCGCAPDSVTYIAALKACISLAIDSGNNGKEKCLEWGRKIHSEIGCHLSHYVKNTLVNMYAKCGSMIEARVVFDSIDNPDVVCWTALLLGYVDNGNGFAALELFSRMKDCGCAPDYVAYIAALRACISQAANGDISVKRKYLERGREIHSKIDCDLDHFLQNTLIDMYAKCGSMVDARRVFDSMHNPNVVSWTALLLGYADNGEASTALEIFSRMKMRGYVPDAITYSSALKACAILAVTGYSRKEECLELGREIHSEIGHNSDHYLQNTLIDMYGKCGSMADAHRVFDSIEKPTVVSWTVLLLGYAENGEGLTALDLFSKMKCAPDSVTHIAVLKACTLIGDLRRGRKFHLAINDFTARLVTCLVDFYAKCGSLLEARQVFELHTRVRAVPTWNALLAGYCTFESSYVFKLFQEMQDEGFRPDSVTFLCILMCCSHAGLVEKAMEYFEAMPLHYGVIPTLNHYNCMVDILGRANRLNEAIAMLRKMPCNPDAVSWRVLLCACRKWKNVEIGMLAFPSLVDFDKNDTSPYILMAHVYGSRGMWEEQGRLLETLKL